MNPIKTKIDPSKRFLIMDGDIIAYKCAAAVETPIDWGGGLWTLHAVESEAREKAASFIADVAGKAGCAGLLLAFSAGDNFRKTLAPSYKGHRNEVRKPMVLKPLVNWLREEYDSASQDGLEADDLIGMFATEAPEETVVWSEDKDMMTVPGIHYKHKDDEFIKVSQELADYVHFKQTLTGDTADGYKGCPTVGDKTAEKLLEAAVKDWWQNGDDGSFEDRNAYIWRHIVKAYEKQGLTEDDAILQARLARILRTSDWNPEKKEISLWLPPQRDRHPIQDIIAL